MQLERNAGIKREKQKKNHNYQKKKHQKHRLCVILLNVLRFEDTQLLV